jgi:kynureninase
MILKNSLEYALSMDEKDELKNYRERFDIPVYQNESAIYLVGNSLGLQPKSARKLMNEELSKWSELGVLAHHVGENQWLTYVDELNGDMAKIVGGKSTEVVIMNSLTVNLHLLMISFYRPSDKRNKIMIDGNAFPSDRYAIYSQVELHGLDPKEVIIEINPKDGEIYFQEDDVIEQILKYSRLLAIVWLEGVNFYHGKILDIKKIVEAGHKVGALVGFDLAHAAGNIELRLNEWELDFACWCTYKYLNAGPGSLGCIFVNEKHHNNTDIPILSGWWSNKVETRFLMKPIIDKYATAGKWQLSNPSIFAACPLRASLELFSEVGMEALLKKSKSLTDYFEDVLLEINGNSDKFKIITPRDHRGCQISIKVKDLENEKGKQFVEDLCRNGSIVDWREPDVIRCAPVPFYNTYVEIYKFGKIFQNMLEKYNI